MDLSNEEIERYKRNILIDKMGEEAQKKLKSAKVLVVGAGGLGSPTLLYLVASGVGKVGIIDGDSVDASNLQRQILHFTKDVNRRKVESAKEKLLELNPNVEIEIYDEMLVKENAKEIISKYDVVASCSDNFEAKVLVNKVCVELNKPFSHSGAIRLEGQITTIIPHETPCFHCLYGDLATDGSLPTGGEIGILGSVAGVLGTLQATEIIKLITSLGENLKGRMLHFDGERMKFFELKIEKKENCEVCGK